MTQQQQNLKRSRTASPASFPDIVDARIRAEMASIQQRDRDNNSSSFSSASSSASDAASDEDEGDDDDEDEDEMRRLTQERGFGLGSWLDRLVEWTLFSVDDQQQQSQQQDDQNDQPAGGDDDDGKSENQTKARVSDEDDYDYGYDESDAISAVVEKPGGEGGWQDFVWLLRVAVGNALT